jgi:hypothetical protein
MKKCWVHFAVDRKQDTFGNLSAETAHQQQKHTVIQPLEMIHNDLHNIVVLTRGRLVWTWEHQEQACLLPKKLNASRVVT